jgi:hypothetical protein
MCAVAFISSVSSKGCHSSNACRSTLREQNKGEQKN